MKINELVLRNRFVVEAGPVPPVDDPAAAPAATTTPPAVTTPPAATTTPATPAAKPAAPAAKGPGFVAQLGKGLDSLKAGIAGAKAGYGANQAQRAGTEQAEKIGAMFADKWNKAIGQNPALNTPANLQMFMKNNTKDSGIKIPPPPPELNPAATTKYIIDVTSQSLAASALGMPAEEPAAQKPTGPALAPVTQPQAAQQQADAEPVAPEQSADTTQAATDTPAQQQIQQPVKGFGDKSIPVTPTTVTQVTPSSAAPKTKEDADKLIKQTAGDPEKIKAMLAALQGTTE